MSASRPVILTANLAAKSKRWQRATWDARLDDIGSGVDYFTPDLVAVQEAGSDSYLRKLDPVMREVGLLRAHGGSRWRYIYFRPTTMLFRQGGTIRLNSLNTRHAAWGRFQTHADVRRGLFFTSSHLSVGWTSFTDRARLREARALLRRSNELDSRWHYPQVHAGDFNSYAMVGDKVMEPAGFRDAEDKPELWKHHSGYDSYNGRNTVRVPTTPMPMHGHHDDHIYVSPELDALTWTLRADYGPSDHNFVAAKLRFTKAG